MRWEATVLVGAGALLLLASGLAYSDLMFLTVSGSSMEPTITSDDLVVVNPGADRLDVGDVVTYRHSMDGETYTFTHRVAGVDDGSLQTKGDALPAADGYEVRKNDVVGKVVLVMPLAGGLVRFVNSPVGFPLFVLLPASLLILVEARDIWRELKCV